MKNAESSAFKVLVEAIREKWFQVCTIYPGFGGGGYVLMVPIMQEKNTNFSFNKIPEGLWRYKKKYFDAKKLDAL